MGKWVEIAKTEKGFIEKDKLQKADLETLYDLDYSYEYLGIEVNEDGDLYLIGKEELLFEDIEDLVEKLGSEEYDEIYMAKYWDGYDLQYDIYESEDLIFETAYIEELEAPNPCDYFNYKIVFKDKNKGEIKATQSNTSGSLSPYYIEKD